MYLGIDLGTSGVKSIIIDDNQNVVGEASSRPLDVERAHPGWSEQHPDLWWSAVCETLDELKATQPDALSAVEGIGLSGQMYGATVLDSSDRPLRNAILWNDTRSGAECAQLFAAVPELVNIVYRRPTPGVTASKLLWLRRHEPKIFSAIETVLLPKDYIRLCLSGEKCSDMADSSGTMWVDLAHRSWSNRMLAATGLDSSQMPVLCAGNGPIASGSCKTLGNGKDAGDRRRWWRQRLRRLRDRRDRRWRRNRFARHVRRAVSCQ